LGMSGAEYFDATDATTLAKALRRPEWCGKFEQMAKDALRAGADWRSIADAAFYYVAEGCGVNG
jgi:hypothetical protein